MSQIPKNKYAPKYVPISGKPVAGVVSDAVMASQLRSESKEGDTSTHQEKSPTAPIDQLQKVEQVVKDKVSERDRIMHSASIDVEGEVNNNLNKERAKRLYSLKGTSQKAMRTKADEEPKSTIAKPQIRESTYDPTGGNKMVVGKVYLEEDVIFYALCGIVLGAGVTYFGYRFCSWAFSPATKEVAKNLVEEVVEESLV